MVKKQNNVWIVYVIALIAIVALILSAVAIHKANMTGNAFWDFLKVKEKPVCGNGVCEPPTENNFTCPEDCVNNSGDGPEGVGVGYGMLGGAFINGGGNRGQLINYQVSFNKEGNLAYEISPSEEGSQLKLGEGYSATIDPENKNALRIENSLGDWTIPPFIICGCQDTCESGTCTMRQSGSSYYCQGHCTAGIGMGWCATSCDWNFIFSLD